MYIRPDSPRLPSAIKDLKGRFCGHNRKTTPCLGLSSSDFLSISSYSAGMDERTLLTAGQGFFAGLFVTLLVSALARRSGRFRDNRRTSGPRF
jgi:hypothetical protein